MATATGNYASDNSTLANFQAWTTAIFNAFVTTCGWVQTADSGQAANPIASVPSSAYVYWIFKANDAAAATLPIYVKVGLGFSATSPRIQITVGTGSNGSGTITGATINGGSPWTITANNANQGATTFPCFFSGNAGEFRMMMWQSGGATNSTNPACLFGVERSKDSSGAVTTDYFTCIAMNKTANQTTIAGGQQSVMTTSLSANQRICVLASSLVSPPGTGAFNGTVTAYPIFPDVGKVGNPMLGFMQVYSADISDGATVTVASMYGATHNYIGYNNSTGTTTNWMGCPSAGSALLMRYE